MADCILSSSSAGIRIGYFSSRVRDIQIQNCTIYNSNRGICIMACKGGYVKNVAISGLMIDTRSRVGGWWGMGEAIYISGLGHELHHNYREGYDERERKYNIENITIRDMTAHCENGIVIAGEHHNIYDIRFYNIRLTLKEAPNRSYFGDKMDFLPSKVVRTVPKGQLYWFYASFAERVLVQDYQVESEIISKPVLIDSFVESCKNLILTPIW